jgi:hypothetical protein
MHNVRQMLCKWYRAALSHIQDTPDALKVAHTHDIMSDDSWDHAVPNHTIFNWETRPAMSDPGRPKEAVCHGVLGNMRCNILYC